MTTGFEIQKGLEFSAVDKVAVDGHGKTKGGVDVEGLCFGPKV